MTIQDFIESWRFFLERLSDFGQVWTDNPGSGLTGGPLERWKEVVRELLEHLNEFGEAAIGIGDQETLCEIVAVIGIWAPGGSPSGAFGSFALARMIKGAVEHWLGPRLSSHTRSLLEELNHLLGLWLLQPTPMSG